MRRPRLAFVGLGWVGARRLEAVAAAGTAEIAALCDTDPARLDAAGEAHRSAERFADYDALLGCAEELRLDGVVLATPNALHAPQALAALDRGLAVFCQKPLACRAADARAIVEAARRADRLLDVDYSYRHTDAAASLRRLARSGELGRIFSIESVFHNAYGPGKAWCHDPAAAGGGALLDLGVHLVDLALWILDFPAVRAVYGQAFRHGRPLDGPGEIDDFAAGHLRLADGTVVHIAASWNAHAGQDCVIRTAALGTAGGAELRNVGGSFYEFELARFTGRQGAVVGRESHTWAGRAIVAWTERLARSAAYHPAAEQNIPVLEVVEEIYRGG